MTYSEQLYIGTSGWSYPWKGVFYPEELPSADYLPYMTQFFNCTEINSSFYHFTMPKTIEKWLDITPPTFKFCAKLHQEITHERRLDNVEEPLVKFMSRYIQMGERLGPVLIQLPASFRYEPRRCEQFFSLLRRLYPTQAFAIEVRNKTWMEEEPLSMLRQHNITWVITDSPRWPKLETATSDAVYLRLHGQETLYSGPYSDEALERYSFMVNDWLLDGKQVWIFFNNTIGASAVKDAERMQQLLQERR